MRNNARRCAAGQARVWLSALALCAMAVAPAAAQLARKPSYYQQQNPPQAEGPAAQGTPRAGVPGSLPALRQRADFDALARVYDAGTPMQLAHVLFVVDRQARPVRTHYLDTPRYQLHVRFVRDTGLSPRAGKREIDRNYLVPDRRFLFGTLSWQQNIGSFTYEFWEGDRLTAALLRQADAQVKASFFAPVKFKTNSTLHDRVAQEAGVDFVSQAALIRAQPFLPLNLGTATGRVRIVDGAAGLGALRPDDIAVLREVPLGLPPVAGVLTERPSTALSHVNLLAKGWGIPNAYVRDAAAVLKEHASQWVALKVAASGYQVRRLTAEEIVALPPRAVRTASTGATPGAAQATRPDLREDRLLPLASLRARNSAQCGTKAANLGALQAARIPGTSVPDGFCIPFGHYDRFMRTHGLAERIARMQQQPGFASDPTIRQQALAQLREEIVQWPVDAATAASWRAAWQAQLGGGGVFVRSSSNSEDLPGFSGAGLYTTVPNVRSGDALERAVKTVWASVFNPEAWEARGAAGFGAQSVLMGVFVQAAIDATNAGVMITRDPFDAGHAHTTYISAKRGIGIRVVEGRRVAEQVMYSSWSKAIQVLSRSAEATSLQLDKDGGVKEVPVEEGRAVLTDELVVRLATVGAAVKRRFDGVDQDIEWATVGDRIVLLQARPYVERR
ncbi:MULTISPECIES: PEP/pyruvate-binding domain-containing protein [unclassified Variovorax]|uniref:PEP/pyruvate-binding domain-containing protein n=1 Tax=unclassified Variovorax TaxID=663243 RepID=UPI0025750AC8|nr:MULTISPECIES: PEP/pyruvate-binding domain-containing protein [unclassified Variovorax]MDM0089931.1 PEP/pyruvate-binding domain-containing protein [Variovorax sp. J22G40]MDM0148403.1 PEP/pyruvate-binding domain-containing protein [Variovorax sp. J2P1-31]